MKEASPKAIWLKDYQPPGWLVDKVHLWFDLREQGTRVRSRLCMRRNPAADDVSELWLDGEELKPVAFILDGKPLPESAYSIEENGVRIDAPPDEFVLETEVEIAPENNSALEGLYRSGDMFCTQCEAEGFRRITWYPDRPDVMARFTTTIEAEKSRFPVLLSNGNPTDAQELENGRHRITWDDPFPKPGYLFALVAGNLAVIEDSFETTSGRMVDLRIYSEPENIDKCSYAMRSLKEAMRWDEMTYGREYDLDIFMIVAVNDFNMGAMENKGLNIFNAKLLLALPETATDADYQAIEGVVAHEYFHNWTGNRITCRDWFQLSLKEGFTVFRDQEFSADMGSRSVKRIQDVRMLRAHQFAEDAGPMAHPVRPDSYMEINNFYTLTVYEKGAEVVRMQANLLGPERFRKATDLYFERHDGQAVTTDDFVACMEEASGKELTQFKLWYSQSGTPELLIKSKYDADTGKLELTVTQSCPPTPGQPEKLPMHIPLAIGLIDPEGHDLPVTLDGERSPGPTTRVLELREETERFVFVDLGTRPVLSLLRDFSAPVKARVDYSAGELMFLLAHDSNGFARWDAAQLLHLQVLQSLIADPEARLPEDYLQAIQKALANTSEDRELLAELLTLPSESYIGDQMDVIDVDAIHTARTGLMRRIAKELRQEFFSVYEASHDSGAFSYEHAAIARRALKNLALRYLSMLEGDAEVESLVRRQYETQQNMTDVSAALSCCVHAQMPSASALLADFEERWKEQPLVMDKWFSIQATSRQANLVPHIRELMQHPGFALGNPNRVRALIGAFASGNPARFHTPDGSGYQLLADVVLELDGTNPQIASRLLRTMSRWRKYDDNRSILMRAQLQRIRETDGLSKDVLEIVSKSLEG
jgi:aminopeptidase N